MQVKSYFPINIYFLQFVQLCSKNGTCNDTKPNDLCKRRTFEVVNFWLFLHSFLSNKKTQTQGSLFESERPSWRQLWFILCTTFFESTELGDFGSVACIHLKKLLIVPLTYTTSSLNWSLALSASHVHIIEVDLEKLISLRVFFSNDI